MDIRMPIMDGYEATKIIRTQTSRIPQPVIIAVTASVFQEKQAEVMSSGCDDIVRKPFKENDIIEMLKKHLNIKFLYAAEEIPAGSANAKNADLKLSPSDFDALPKEMVMKFKESVGALEMDTALTVIEEIRGHNQPLAEALQKLVGEYRFDKLQQLLDQS
jgi:CheY-like chemotaxis protein